jgi:nitroreductase
MIPIEPVRGGICMQEFMDVVRQRRSVRKYEETPIPDEKLDTLLEAVKWAPSWANTQCWEIIVIKDPVVKEKLQSSLPAKGQPATKAMVQAPVVLAVCGKTKSSGYYKDLVTTKFGDWFMFDLGIACQNICLTAHSLGLGTVMVGLFDHDKAAGILNVPAGYELVVLIPLGFPAKQTSAPRRREISEFIHHDTF